MDMISCKFAPAGKMCSRQQCSSALCRAQKLCRGGRGRVFWRVAEAQDFGPSQGKTRKIEITGKKLNPVVSFSCLRLSGLRRQETTRRRSNRAIEQFKVLYAQIPCPALPCPNSKNHGSRERPCRLHDAAGWSLYLV